MPRLHHKVIDSGAKKVPGLRRMPVLKLLIIGELILLARQHLALLDARERQRLLTLVRKGRGRNKTNLTAREQNELARLVAKAEPKRFAMLAAEKMSPMPIPGVSSAKRSDDLPSKR